MRNANRWTLIATMVVFGLFMAGLSPGRTQKKEDPEPASAEAQVVNHMPEKAEFTGSDACFSCHEGAHGSGWLKLPHGKFLTGSNREFAGKGCEDCHGPGSVHAEDPPGHILNPTNMTAKAANDLCLACHKDKIRSHDWQTGAHAVAKVKCFQCHTQHDEKADTLGLKKSESEMCMDCHRQIAVQFRQNSHHPVREGKVECTDCHNVHSGRHEGMLIADEKTTCTRCHGDVAGPFVYEHDPLVNGISEPCTECHRSHGSPNTRLLKFAGRGTCLQCHTDKSSGHFPGTCWNCHTKVHGSNSDPALRQ